MDRLEKQIKFFFQLKGRLGCCMKGLRPENTHHWVKNDTVRLAFSLTGLASTVSLHKNNNIFSSLVKFNQVKLETGHAMILPQQWVFSYEAEEQKHSVYLLKKEEQDQTISQMSAHLRQLRV